MKTTLAIFVGLMALNCLAEPPLKSGIEKEAFDTSIKPGDDFFKYVNGGWIKAHPIPDEYSRWDADSEIRERNLVQLREIMDDLVKQTGALDEDRRKLRDLYITAMDEAALEKQGASPLADDLDKIAKLKGPEDLAAAIAEFRGRGLDFVFSVYIDQDEKQSTRYVTHVYQGGLGLPEREYYLGDTEDSKKIRGQYVEHVTKMLTLLGDAPADAAAGAAAIMRIEGKLAEASRTPTALRDPEANYNKKTIAELAALSPTAHWADYLKAMGATSATEVIVGQPEFVTAADGLLKSMPIADWRTYLRWHLIDETATYLSSPFEKEQFHFRGEVMRGVKEMRPRWKRALSAVDDQMGEVLGRLYVEKHFPPAAKKRMDELVANLKAVYRQRIETRDWMSPETRKQAVIKLDAMNSKIGYPSKWRDYSTLEIKPDSYVKNALRASAYESRYRVARLDKPVDRTEWDMTPPTVNAYYSGSMNEIVFPAGILQPPFFDLQADDALNYGAIGATIGHEMTHGFDDEGSHMDADGNLRDWWTAEDRTHFESKTAKLAAQFDECVGLEGLHVNGKLTLGENLADLGGLLIAYDAYIKSLHGQPAPVIDGFTGPQRFFLGYSQSWRGHVREAEQRVRLRTDPHAPERFRVLMPLSNMSAFYEAFNVKPGDAMYRKPEDRVEVW